MRPLSGDDLAVLASAYQLSARQVEQDAARLLQWQGSEAALLIDMQARHGWTHASEYAPYYVADLRLAIQPFSRNGSASH